MLVNNLTKLEILGHVLGFKHAGVCLVSNTRPPVWFQTRSCQFEVKHAATYFV